MALAQGAGGARLLWSRPRRSGPSAGPRGACARGRDVFSSVLACSCDLAPRGSSSSSSSGSSSSSSSSRGCTTGSRRRPRLECRASASGEPVRKQLPIFPLGVVALPHAVVPLMIFEARYRVLFNTLLAGADNVDEGLVQQESPFAGTRRFGMCYVDDKGRLTAVGTTLEIQDFVLEPGGRMYVTNKGVERFKITKVVAEKPVLLCEVEVLPGDDDESDEAKALASEVADLFRNVLRLHLKMNRSRMAGRSGGAGGGLGAAAGGASGAAEPLGSEAEDESIEAAELTESNPQQLSFWVAHAFTDSKFTQQALLEENSTMVRLNAEKELLTATLKYYTAATALEGVFSSGGGGGGAGSGEAQQQPPPGGPD